MNGSIFVPAIGPVMQQYWKKQTTFNGYDLKWFSDKSMFQHPVSLVSSYFEVNRNPDYRKTIEYPDNYKLISDSGGFQVASFRKKGISCKITPINILQWQENNANIGMNLDIPPGLDDHLISFKDCLKISVQNFDIFRDNRKNFNTFKLYNVLHGRNLNEIKLWFNTVKDYPFDGWAIGIKGLPYQHIYAYMYLFENNALNLKNNTHIFGLGGLHNMISLAMLSNHFNVDLTFDSSSWAMGSRTRRFYFPNDNRFYVEFRRNCNKLLNNIPCKCPVCKNISINDYYNQTDGIIPLLLSLHNLYQFIEVNNIINILVKDEDYFDSFVKSRFEEELVQNINKMFTLFDQGGCKLVENKCQNLINPKSSFVVDKARNLFSFK